VAELPVQPEPQIAYYLLAEPPVTANQEVPYTAWNFNAFSYTPAQSDRGQTTAGAAPISALAASPAPPASPESQTPPQNGVASGTLQYQNLPRSQSRGQQSRSQIASNELARSLDRQTTPDTNQPVKLELSKELANRQLALSVRSRGATVAEATLNAPPSGDAQKDKAVFGGENKAQAAEQVAVTVPPEAEGLLEVDVFDRSKQQTQPVERQLVYRQPRRRLNIDVAGAKARYAPGEQAELKLQCTDERGAPAANTRLGVRVWNEVAIQQSGDEPVLLADAVDHELADGASDAAESAAADASRARAAFSDRDEKAAAITLIATENARPVVVQLASNRDALGNELHNKAAQADAIQQHLKRTIGIASVAGGLVLLASMFALVMARRLREFSIAAPAIVVSLASLLIGFQWMIARPSAQRISPRSFSDSNSAERPQATRAIATESFARSDMPSPPGAPAAPVQIIPRQVAQNFAESLAGPASQLAGAPAAAPASAATRSNPSEPASRRIAGAVGGAAGAAANSGPTPAIALSAKKLSDSVRLQTEALDTAKPAAADRAAKADQSAAAPAAIFFNPEIQTDAAGAATVRFTMPSVQSEYRLMIDAIGDGRLGSRQQTIVCGPPDK
jgi:hypothetical protein